MRITNPFSSSFFFFISFLLLFISRILLFVLRVARICRYHQHHHPLLQKRIPSNVNSFTNIITKFFLPCSFAYFAKVFLDSQLAHSSFEASFVSWKTACKRLLLRQGIVSQRKDIASQKPHSIGNLVCVLPFILLFKLDADNFGKLLTEPICTIAKRSLLPPFFVASPPPLQGVEISWKIKLKT